MEGAPAEGPFMAVPKRKKDLAFVEKEPAVVNAMKSVLMPKRVSKESLRHLQFLYYYGTTTAARVPKISLLENTTVVVKDGANKYRMSTKQERERRKPPKGVYELLRCLSLVEAHICCRNIGSQGKMPYWFDNDYCDKEFYYIILESEPLFVHYAATNSPGPMDGFLSEKSKSTTKLNAEFKQKVDRVSIATRRFLSQHFMDRVVRGRIEAVTADFNKGYTAALEDVDRADEVISVMEEVYRISQDGLNGLLTLEPKEFALAAYATKQPKGTPKYQAGVEKMKTNPRDDLHLKISMVSALAEVIKGNAPKPLNKDLAREEDDSDEYDFSGLAKREKARAVKRSNRTEVQKIMLKSTLTAEDAIELTRWGGTYNSDNNSIVMPNGDEVPSFKLVAFAKSETCRTMIANNTLNIKKQLGLVPLDVEAPHPVNHRAASGADMMLNLPRHIEAKIPALRQGFERDHYRCIKQCLLEYAGTFGVGGWRDTYSKSKILFQSLHFDINFCRILIKRNVLRGLCNQEAGGLLRVAYGGQVYGVGMTDEQINQGISAQGDRIVERISKKRAIQPAADIFKNIHCGVVLARILRALNIQDWVPGLSMPVIGRLLDFAPKAILEQGTLGLIDLGIVTPGNNMLMIPPSKAREIDEPDSLANQNRMDLFYAADILYFLAGGPTGYGAAIEPRAIPNNIEVNLLASTIRLPIDILVDSAAALLKRGNFINYAGAFHTNPLLTLYAVVLIIALTDQYRGDNMTRYGEWLSTYIDTKKRNREHALPEPDVTYGRLTVVLRNILSGGNRIDVDTGTCFYDCLAKLSKFSKGLLVIIMVFMSKKDLITDAQSAAIFINCCQLLAQKLQEMTLEPEVVEKKLPKLTATIRRFVPIDQLLNVQRGLQPINTPERTAFEWVIAGGVARRQGQFGVRDTSAPAQLDGTFIPEHFCADLSNCARAWPRSRQFAQHIMANNRITPEDFQNFYS